jgi:hypothetical protein
MSQQTADLFCRSAAFGMTVGGELQTFRRVGATPTQVWFSLALLIDLFKVFMTVDLMVVLQGFQMTDHFGSHRRVLLNPLFNFGGQ